MTRVVGLLLSGLFLFGQGSLAAHTHGGQVSGSKSSISRHDHDADGVDCFVCGLTAHSQTALAAARAPAADANRVDRFSPAPRVSLARSPILRASSRAPPALFA